MPYLIQAEERDVPYELFEHLANIIDESPVLTYADATSELHHGHGILHFEDQAEAERLLGRFNAIGFRCFLLDTLLNVPAPETVHLPAPTLEAQPELVAVARLDTVTEKKEWSFSPWRTRLSILTNLPVQSGVEERTVEQSDSSYCLDLLTRTRHWRARGGYWAPIREYLGRADLSAAYCTTAVKKLIANDRNIIHFGSEADYDHYVKWLYQLQYAKP
jgi:hypothetical protein